MQTDRITKEKKEGVLLALRVEKMVKKEKKKEKRKKKKLYQKANIGCLIDRKLLFGKQIKDISKQISQEGHA